VLKAAERTVYGLWTAIGRVIDLFTPAECENYFKAAGWNNAFKLRTGDDW